MKNIILPAEWTKNSTIQLTWPHAGTDWVDMLDEAEECFVNLAIEILKRQDLLIVCNNEKDVRSKLEKRFPEIKTTNGKLLIREIETNDTWARDHGAITTINNGVFTLNDFTFNGWGLKFASDLDNQINRRLNERGVFAKNVQFENKKAFVLEGGSIESDGKGTILTTAECLLSPNRNPYLTREQIEHYLAENLGAKRILWLDNGYLEGDDTDSHIDTLARLCDEKTIAYVKCTDENDVHYDSLSKMEKEIEAFRTVDNEPYNLVALPMAPKIYDEELRLPTTYANFLILDDAILMPTYNDEKVDNEAKEKLKKAFPKREIVGVNCTALVYQHGSLHCVTMQYPDGIIDKSKALKTI